jgi:Type II secretion system (T2SS), protein E, N-terminal domain
MRELLKPLTWSGHWARRWEETRLSCGLISCTGAKSLWQRAWRRQNGTFLQGVYYCQPQCVETALLAQLARLQAMASAAPPPHRIPLGLLMVARGQLTYEQVVTALAAQQSGQSAKIGEWFERLGFATEQEVTSALGLQWGCPVASSLDPPGATPFGRIPLAILEAFQMLPLHYVPTTNTLNVAFGERVDHAALYAIEKILDCRTQPCVGRRKSIAWQLERMRQQPRPSEVEFGPVRNPAEMGRISASYIARMGAEDVRIGRVGRFIWLRLKARTSHVNMVFRLQVESAHAQSTVRPPLPAGMVLAPSATLG